MDGVSLAVGVAIPTVGLVALGVYGLRVADSLVRDLLTPRLLGVTPEVAKTEKVANSNSRQSMPEHVKALALVESESWAQDQVLQAMQETYEETGDWQKVAELFSGAHS